MGSPEYNILAEGQDAADLDAFLAAHPSVRSKQSPLPIEIQPPETSLPWKDELDRLEAAIAQSREELQTKIRKYSKVMHVSSGK